MRAAPSESCRRLAMAETLRLPSPRRLRQQARAVWRASLDLLFPPRCLFCDIELMAGRGPLLCTDCRGTLSISKPRCPRCGMSMGQPVPQQRGCHHCRRQRFHFERVIALGTYRAQLREAVLRMKRPTGEALSAALGRLLWQRGCRELREAGPTLVAPVPMHWTRRLVRQTNSPELIAEALGRELRAPVHRRLLKRTRRTAPQGNLSATRRRENVRGSLAVRQPRACRGATILLVDDVLTTGSTANEAARALAQAGASRIIVAVVARSESED